MDTIQSAAALNLARFQNAYYPGRGIVIGRTPSGDALVQVYWTMGRSQNSRNRILVREGEHVVTRPIDATQEIKNEDLLMYRANAQVGCHHVVTNGRQTDTIAEHLARGDSFESAQYQWSFETDPPISTSRISGVATIDPASGEYGYKLGIIKALERNQELLSHQCFSYRHGFTGFGHLIHTYHLEQVAYPFTGDPLWMPILEGLEENARYYWDLLDPNMRVGLYAKRIEIATGAWQDTVLSYV